MKTFYIYNSNTFLFWIRVQFHLQSWSLFIMFHYFDCQHLTRWRAVTSSLFSNSSHCCHLMNFIMTDQMLISNCKSFHTEANSELKHFFVLDDSTVNSSTQDFTGLTDHSYQKLNKTHSHPNLHWRLIQDIAALYWKLTVGHLDGSTWGWE